jgi:hypothetical protein
VFTLYATGLIVALLLVPGLIFRSCFSFFLPLRKFQRTRTEELAFAVKVCFVPLAVATLLAWSSHFPVRGPLPPHVGGDGLRPALFTVLWSAFDDAPYKGEPTFRAFAQASRQTWIAVANWLLCYYALLAIEAGLLGWLSSNFGDFRRSRAMDLLMRKALLPGISEWHVLLTTFGSPKEPPRVAVADVLTTDDHLYHGRVENYYLNKDGDLTGILLADVFRFNRAGYARDLENGPVANRQPYWKFIPGKNVYIFADKITNLNVNYELEAAIRIKRELGLDPTLQLAIQST